MKEVKIDKKTAEVLRLIVEIGKEYGLSKKESRILYSRYNGGNLLDPIQRKIFEGVCDCYSKSGMKHELMEYLKEYHDPNSIEEEN